MEIISGMVAAAWGLWVLGHPEFGTLASWEFLRKSVSPQFYGFLALTLGGFQLTAHVTQRRIPRMLMALVMMVYFAGISFGIEAASPSPTWIAYFGWAVVNGFIHAGLLARARGNVDSNGAI